MKPDYYERTIDNKTDIVVMYSVNNYVNTKTAIKMKIVIGGKIYRSEEDLIAFLKGA